jgi:hypothetical protein
MKIVIPDKGEGDFYTRLELEKWLRDNILTKFGHNGIMKLAGHYGIHNDIYSSAPTILLIHFLLDRMQDQSGKAGEVKCVYEKMGLVNLPTRTRAVDGVKRYKIKIDGIEYSNMETNAEFMKHFVQKLADFIKRGWAMIPTETEGVDVDRIRRLVGIVEKPYEEPPKLDFSKYLQPFIPPPPPAPLPEAEMRKELDPSVGRKVKRISIDMEVKNLKADVEEVKKKQERTSNRLDSLEVQLAKIKYGTSL